MSKNIENIDSSAGRPSREITAEMRKEFWKYDINSHSGHPTSKEKTGYQTGQEFSTKGEGVRYACSSGYQSSKV